VWSKEHDWLFCVQAVCEPRLEQSERHCWLKASHVQPSAGFDRQPCLVVYDTSQDLLHDERAPVSLRNVPVTLPFTMHSLSAKHVASVLWAHWLSHVNVYGFHWQPWLTAVVELHELLEYMYWHW